MTGKTSPASAQASAPENVKESAPASAAGRPAQDIVVVKKYANRRLYNTESSSYITLENLAGMVRAGRDFIVYDARSGEDITRSVLTQIIVEEENKGNALLPTAFLRQLIGFYGDGMGGVMPRMVEQGFAALQRQQEQVREAVDQTLGSILPPGIDEIRRQNVAMMERALSLFSPFHRNDTPAGAADAAAPVEAGSEDELATLRAEVARLRGELATATPGGKTKAG
jgi:polyhydroxyalkanoate synthesis repressor PhaR